MCLCFVWSSDRLNMEVFNRISTTVGTRAVSTNLDIVSRTFEFLLEEKLTNAGSNSLSTRIHRGTYLFLSATY